MRDGADRQYTREWLQFDRPQPMYDSSINHLYDRVYRESPAHNNNLVDQFKEKFIYYLDDHILNNIRGYNNFPIKDICIGCSQFIDDIYQRVGTNNVMIFENDYRYHWRLNNAIKYVTLDTLDSSKELIISMPFPYYGDIHLDMEHILDKCLQLGIPVHIDAAWLSCSKNIYFNFDHPAIKTFAISLSKGGLGSNRIALRFARQQPPGAITIMNQYNMNCQSLLYIGIQYIELIGAEYFWKKYGSAYSKVCADFDLIPTKSIHLAKTRDGQPVGIRPLLRCLL
jgi:hypothetical protein